MPSIRIPDIATKDIKKPSRGEIFGNVWATKNIDFLSNKGKIVLSERLYRLFDDGDDADFDVPVAFIRTNADGTERYIAVCQEDARSITDGFIWKTTGIDPLAGWAQDTVLNTPVDCIDNAIIFGQTSGYDRLIIPRSTDLAMLNNSNSGTKNILSSTDATPIEITTSASHGLFTGDKVTIAGHTTNTNANGTWTIIKTGATTFTLTTSTATGGGVGGATGTVTHGKWIRSWWTGTLAQVALSNTNPHFIYQFSNLILVPDGNVLHVIDDSLVVKTNRITLPAEFQIIWIADDGRRVYLGTKNIRDGEAYVFPWPPTLGGSETYDQPKRVYDSISFAGVTLDGVIHTINGKGQLLKDNGIDFVEVAALPIVRYAAKWRDSLTNRKEIHPNGMKVFDDKKITLLINAAINGTNFTTLQNMPSGIWEYDPDIGLYAKYMLGQYDGSTNNDWGAAIITRNGAIYQTDKQNGHFLAGADVYSDSGSTVIRAMFTSKVASTASHRGSFMTSQLQGNGVRNWWERISVMLKKFENSTDAIVVKYRVTKKAIYETDLDVPRMSITWVDTDTFTTTDTDFANAVVGEEVEILVGKGAGALAHISAISFATPTYTVDLDEAIPNVTGTALMRLQNWKKLGSFSDQTIQKKMYTLAKRNKWIQFKVELRGTITSPEIEELFIEFKPSAR